MRIFSSTYNFLRKYGSRTIFYRNFYKSLTRFFFPGCNHMICKNQACKNDFCWVCLGPWEPHGSSWYNCNRYDEDEARSAREGQEKSRAALTRYLFYCNRYMNHLQSLKFENKLYTMVKVSVSCCASAFWYARVFCF